jgi:hypothetical protein
MNITRTRARARAHTHTHTHTHIRIRAVVPPDLEEVNSKDQFYLLIFTSAYFLDHAVAQYWNAHRAINICPIDDDNQIPTLNFDACLRVVPTYTRQFVCSVVNFLRVQLRGSAFPVSGKRVVRAAFVHPARAPAASSLRPDNLARSPSVNTQLPAHPTCLRLFAQALLRSTLNCRRRANQRCDPMTNALPKSCVCDAGGGGGGGDIAHTSRLEYSANV